MEYLALFFTHSGAVKYDRYLKSLDISSQLMPVPRKLSSSCGIGAAFHYSGDISQIISADIEKLFSKEEKEYRLIYATE